MFLANAYLTSISHPSTSVYNHTSSQPNNYQSYVFQCHITIYYPNISNLLPPNTQSITVQTSSPPSLSSIDLLNQPSTSLILQSSKNPITTSTWFSNLQPVSIKPFVSSIGPRVTIPNSSLEVF